MMKTMQTKGLTLSNGLYVGNALDVLKEMKDCSIDCCVTSPPYYGLRDYGAAGQIGLEETPEKYIEHLAAAFEEVRRILKEKGTLWLNIGDSYAGSVKVKGRTDDGGQRKQLIGIPWLLAFALRANGWYLRQDIIWYKPNCMPESVTDRCTKSHEYIFLFSKTPKYYFDYKAIQEPITSTKGNSRTFRGNGAYVQNQSFENSNTVERKSHGNMRNASGLRRKRDVWSVSTQGFSDAHFATFPEKLIEPCILAGCPVGGVVLDPFLGSGTTAVVAQRLDRKYIGIELNPDYANMAVERIEREKKALCLE